MNLWVEFVSLLYSQTWMNLGWVRNSSSVYLSKMSVSLSSFLKSKWTEEAISAYNLCLCNYKDNYDGLAAFILHMALVCSDLPHLSPGDTFGPRHCQPDAHTLGYSVPTHCSVSLITHPLADYPKWIFDMILKWIVIQICWKVLLFRCF